MRLFNENGRERNGAAVLTAKQEEPKHFSAAPFTVGSIGFLERIPDRPEVAERLAHLFFFAVGRTHTQRPRMHPSARKLMARRCFALGNFVLVMREHQIRAAAVDINGFAKEIHRHG